MRDKVILIDQLLNGTKYSYEHLNKESRLYLLKTLNLLALSNKGIFCLEKKALKRYFKIVKSLGHLGYDTLFAYTFINDLKIELSDRKKYNLYLNNFINCVLYKYKNENEIVTNNKFRIKQIKSHIKLLFSVTNALIPYISGPYLPSSKFENKKLLENSLKYLIKNDEQNIFKYRTFIDFYYEETGINILGLAHTNVIKFSLKKVNNGI